MSNRAQEKTIVCDQCGFHLAPGKVVLSYLGSKFTVELNRCAQCGLVYIPEELALGKIQQLEKTLEDK